MADTKLKADLEARFRSIVDALNASDHDRYASYHTEDCASMYQDNGTAYGREGLLKNMKRLVSNHNIKVSTLEGIDYLQVLSDNKVYSTLTVKCVDSKGKTGAKLRMIILWRKESGEWFIERKFVNLKEITPEAQAHAVIKAQMVVLYDAFTRMDIDGALQVYADQPTWMFHGQENINGKKDGREAFLKLIPEMKTLVLDEIFYFELFGDDVAHTNAYVDLIDENGKVFNRIRDCFLWKKENGKWRIQRDSYNELPLK